MNALGALILVVLSLVVFCSSRRVAVLGVMGGVLYLTAAQQLQVGGVHLLSMRLLVVVAFLRVMMRGEFSFSAMTSIDKTLLLVYLFTVVVSSLRDFSTMANIVGVALDVLLCFFSFRGLLRDADELRWFLKAFLVLLAPYVVLLGIELITHHNLFAVLGAEAAAGWQRGGRTRCTGSFRHPDLLGTLGSSFFPLYIALFFDREQRKAALFGIILCLGIVVASNSGGPLCSIGVGTLGWLLWQMRNKMRMVRWAMLGMLGFMAMIMKAPVWYLLARVSALAGGSGWHRAYLIDMAVQHLREWWFAGMPMTDTFGWFPYNLEATGGADITNEFLSFGIKAGLVAVIIFVILQIRCYKSLGNALAAVRGESGAPSDNEYLLWGLGVVLTVHMVNWFGVTYFDQMYVVWILQLAAISCIGRQFAEPGFNLPTEEVHDQMEPEVMTS